MSDVTKEDIRAVHNRIDDLAKNQIGQVSFNRLVDKVDDLIEGQGQIAVAVGVLQTTQEFNKPPSRPCPDFKELKITVEKHFTSHKEEILARKENLRFWQKPLMAALFDMVKMAIVFAVGWVISKLT